MKDKGSIYQVFSDLAERIKAGAAEPPEAEKSPPAPAAARDEWAAFVEEMKDVKRVEEEDGRVSGRKAEGTPPRRMAPEAPSMEELLKDAPALPVVNLPEYMEGYVEGTSPLVMDKLRSGAFSIQKVLDLHGMTAREAESAFHDFLLDAVQSGLACVKVIHGRGLKSRQGPVLKEKLKGWIVRAMARKWVVAFGSCRMADGGPGATAILLRTHARKKRLHVIG